MLFRSEWNNRIGQFIQRKVRVGDSWKGTQEYALPVGGEHITLFTTTKVGGQTACGRTQCLEIKITYNSDPDHIGKVLNRLIGESDSSVDKSAENTEDPSIEINGEGTRLVDPATLLVYEEDIKRTITMPITVLGDKKIFATITEHQQYNVDYDI